MQNSLPTKSSKIASHAGQEPKKGSSLVGVPSKKIKIYSLPLHFKKILKGSHGGSAVPDLEIPRYINLIKRKKMSLKNLITHQFKLDEINSAIKLLRSGNSGRIVIKMS